MPLARRLTLLFLTACILGTEPVTAQTDDPPNILVLIADDAGWDDFGAYGHPNIRTPNVDRLAESGLKVERAFLTVAQCSPSRISILTGKYPHQTGAEDLHMPLPDSLRIVPGYLSEADYYTGHMRKTHYGPAADAQFDWYAEAADDDFTAFETFLDEAGGRPFFMWVGFTDPHRGYGDAPVTHDAEDVRVPPYLVDDQATRDDLARYYDEIARMDGQIGSLLDVLDERGLRHNTLVVFLSDNGRPFPRAKGTVYDEGIRTPLIFSWPAVIPAGSVYDAGMVSVIDLAPTWLGLAGIAKPDQMAGESLRPLFTDPSVPGREVIFAERNWHDCDEHIRALRTDRFKLVRNAYVELPHGTAADLGGSPSFRSLIRLKERGELTDGQARLFEAPRPRIELYDLENDPYELDNLAAHDDYWQTARELAAVLDDWIRETNDFPPHVRVRDDHTDRMTGVWFSPEIPPMRNAERP